MLLFRCCAGDCLWKQILKVTAGKHKKSSFQNGYGEQEQHIIFSIFTSKEDRVSLVWWSLVAVLWGGALERAEPLTNCFERDSFALETANQYAVFLTEQKSIDFFKVASCTLLDVRAKLRES